MNDELTTLALILGSVGFAASVFSVAERFLHTGRYGEDSKRQPEPQATPSVQA